MGIIRNKHKFAFSLAEAVISMVILGLVGIASVSVMTTSKPKVESTNVRGQYACWKEGGKILEWYIDERTPRTKDPTVVTSSTGCKFKADNKVSKLYILATGAANSNYNAELITKYLSFSSNDMDIALGVNNGDDTVISVDGTEQLTAHGAPSDTKFVSSDIKILKSNISKISMTNSNSSVPVCPTDTSGTPKGCSYAPGNDFFIVDGCEDSDGNPLVVNLSDLERVCKKVGDNNYIIYKHSSSGLYFNITLNNPIYDYEKDYSGVDIKRPVMSDMLRLISDKRSSLLTDKLLNLNFGTKTNPAGAVFIMW